MLEVKKSGSNQYGVWLIGTLELGGLVINSIFSTNLTELPKDKVLKPKKVKMSISKKGLPLFRVEF